jgi:methyl-branched lipid omega-hydroxylase
MDAGGTIDVDDIDLADFDGFWSRPLDEREAAFAALRAGRPIAYYPEPDFQIPGIPSGNGFHVVTRHRDVIEASRRPEVFCSGHGATSIVDMPPFLLEFYGSMINMDDPRHGRLRRIVSRAFTPGMTRRIEAHVQEVASEIVDRVSPLGECDFVTEVASRLPLRVICEMMGVPASQYDFVLARSNVILGAGDPEYVPDREAIVVELLKAGSELSELMTDLGRRRIEEPTDDLTSALVNAEVDGERLSTDELASFFILLAVAGNETTRNAVSWGLHLLTCHPDQRAIWADDFEAVAPTAVEEIVRVASPVMWMRRTLKRDSELSGYELHEGDKLLLFYWSANRDEDVFEEPYRFDVRRSPNEHVGFGGPGPHFCLGAHLARREITVMFRELFRRLPDIEATGEPDRLLSNFINGVKHLSCSFTPSS